MKAFHVPTASHMGEAAIFAALVVFTVLSLETIRIWGERGASARHIRIACALLAFVFLGFAVGGVWNYMVVGKADFLNLAFFLNGCAGLGVLPAVLFGGEKDRELRKIAAHDL